MTEKTMYTIGELSRLCNVTDRTLRYYDKIDLLKPSYIDPENNYRYYSSNDLLIINIVKKMKYNGFKLEDVKKIISNSDIKSLEDIYIQKQREMDAEIERLQQMKKRIDERLEVFKDIFCSYLETVKEETKSKTHKVHRSEITFIEKPAKQIAFLKFTTQLMIEKLLVKCNQFMDMLSKYELDVDEPYMAIYHGDYKTMNTESMDIELCAYLKSNCTSTNKFVRELPAGTYACSTVKGCFKNTREAVIEMTEWLNENGYEINGPVLRVYLFGIEHARCTDNYITELQIPVRKK